jgi:hypothetical protein
VNDLIEDYAHRFFKANEKSYYKQMGKAVGWKELHKEFNFKNFR